MGAGQVQIEGHRFHCDQLKRDEAKSQYKPLEGGFHYTDI